MEQQRIILKRLREENGLTLSEASKLVGRSKGWLSEMENNKGQSVLHPCEYQRLYTLYKGDQYKRSFGAWVKSSPTIQGEQKDIKRLDGAIYKFLRLDKAKFSLSVASKLIEISRGYLSQVESGRKIPNEEMKERILKAYGYSLGSWRNFATSDRRGKSVPTMYRLQILLGQMDEEKIERVFEFVMGLGNEKR